MVQVDKQDVEDLESFVFMGSYISTSGGNEEGICARESPCCVQKAKQDLKGLSVSKRNKVSFKLKALFLLLCEWEMWWMIPGNVE